MFCPRCGQQAVEGVRFCSRCGLPLDAAAELVEAGGLPSTLSAEEGAGRALTPRQRGTRKGLMIMVGGLMFFGLAALLTAIKEDLFIFLPVAALVFTIGLMRMLYGVLLEDGGAGGKSGAGRGAHAEGAARLEGSRKATAALPHARSRPAYDFTNARADAGAAVTPPSVTEQTTALLNEEGGEGEKPLRAGRGQQ